MKKERKNYEHKFLTSEIDGRQQKLFIDKNGIKVLNYIFQEKKEKIKDDEQIIYKITKLKLSKDEIKEIKSNKNKVLEDLDPDLSFIKIIPLIQILFLNYLLNLDNTQSDNLFEKFIEKNIQHLKQNQQGKKNNQNKQEKLEKFIYSIDLIVNRDITSFVHLHYLIRCGGDFVNYFSQLMLITFDQINEKEFNYSNCIKQFQEQLEIPIETIRKYIFDIKPLQNINSDFLFKVDTKKNEKIKYYLTTKKQKASIQQLFNNFFETKMCYLEQIDSEYFNVSNINNIINYKTSNIINNGEIRLKKMFELHSLLQNCYIFKLENHILALKCYLLAQMCIYNVRNNNDGNIESIRQFFSKLNQDVMKETIFFEDIEDLKKLSQHYQDISDNKNMFEFEDLQSLLKNEYFRFSIFQQYINLVREQEIDLVFKQYCNYENFRKFCFEYIASQCEEIISDNIIKQTTDINRSNEHSKQYIEYSIIDDLNNYISQSKLHSTLYVEQNPNSNIPLDYYLLIPKSEHFRESINEKRNSEQKIEQTLNFKENQYKREEQIPNSLNGHQNQNLKFTPIDMQYNQNQIEQQNQSEQKIHQFNFHQHKKTQDNDKFNNTNNINNIYSNNNNQNNNTNINHINNNTININNNFFINNYKNNDVDGNNPNPNNMNTYTNNNINQAQDQKFVFHNNKIKNQEQAQQMNRQHQFVQATTNDTLNQDSFQIKKPQLCNQCRNHYIDILYPGLELCNLCFQKHYLSFI